MPSSPHVRDLIDRIAASLGDDATPDQVERIARAVLHAEGESEAPDRTPARALGTPPSGTRAIVTAFGYDQPGILAALTGALADAGVNILDVSQKILQGYFTVVLLADLDRASTTVQALQDRLDGLGRERGVRIIAQHEDLFLAMHRP